ncbi:MAG: glycoside hydrolase family 43 protein [Mariniphaga sp.]|nr:glycoside hydrolase family 43 protein [Mariniphaga sp.]
MKNQLILFVILIMIIGCSKQQESEKVRMIQNPINPGFYPDPSICQAGDDFYMVNSTFCWFPGIPVFHSRDLVNWKQIGHVLDQTSQLPVQGLQISRGVFAPAIEYHDGIFYVLNTLVDAGGNFIVTATDPAGPWSEKIWLREIDGIDPSMFFDDDGKCYIINNGPPPDNISLYNGHRALWLQEFDYNEMKLIGPRKIIVDGGVDISKEPSWIEGPHIYKIDGLYYLMAAEGGTAEGHSEVIFKSEDVWGPYIPWENNPILAQGGSIGSRIFPITSTGHADLVETSTGEWWAIFLGCQPYEPTAENYYNTGRETFMAPVKWDNGWPIIGEKTDSLLRSYPAPDLPEYKPEGYEPLNQFPVNDDFSEESLALYWNFMRVPEENWYNLKNGLLEITSRTEPLSGRGNPSFIGRRQQHAFCEVSTKMEYFPLNGINEAGLVVWQNEQHYYSLVKTFAEDKPMLKLKKVNEVIAEAELEGDSPLELKIIAKGKDYDFLFRYPEKEWNIVAENVDGTFLSTRRAGGFVGAYFGMYAFGESGNKAVFDWFNYDSYQE